VEFHASKGAKRGTRKMFADFLVANMDIVERVVQAFREGPGAPGKELLREIEERASRGIWE
jgi:hypothetical protein